MAFARARALAGAIEPERAVATAVVVEVTSATLMAVGSPVPVAQNPKAATLVRGADG